jgi:putative pyoverdin transport system ATP-binding/permease protein
LYMGFLFLPGFLFAQKAAFDKAKVDAFIKGKMSSNDIPGAAVVLFKGGNVIYKGEFGYADVKAKRAVDDKTVFELGSNSKAFTAIGILYLEKKGALNLEDPITKYLPWFYCTYKGVTVKDFTIKNFLYQTSGIPFSSIDLIEEGNRDNQLELTVRRLQGTKLSHLPGKSFEYATINYDILGLVIEKVSGQPYEIFMKEKICNGLSLYNTNVGKDNANPANAIGYKRNFLNLKEYDAPVFRGNTPAGYVSADINDVEKWLGRHINAGNNKDLFDSLITGSRKSESPVIQAYENAFYADGWYIKEGIEKNISHGGNNPNFSSFISFDPVTKDGVAVLCNINSGFPQELSAYLLETVKGNTATFHLDDQYKYVDVFSTILIIVSAIFILFSLYNLFSKIRAVVRSKEKTDIKDYFRNGSEVVICLILVSAIGYSLYKIPVNLFNGLSWKFLEVWAPFNFLPAVKLFFGSLVLFFVYYIWSLPFSRKFRGQFYNLAVLSILSGLGNTMIIFTINQSIRKVNNEVSNYFVYFLMGLLLYLLTQRILRKRLIKVSNAMIYEKRNEISEILLANEYEKIEKIPKEEIITVLNNDTLNISRLPNILVGFISSLVTIVFCLVYLGFLDVYAFAGSIAVLAVSVVLFAYAGKFAQKYFEKNRVIQGQYTKFVYDLLNGLKELKVNRKKTRDFSADLNANSREFMETNSTASIKFANTHVLGELLFTLVIGSVVFILPLYLLYISANDIVNFVFVFLYITGPVNGILNLFPELLQIRVSWNRISKFKDTVARLPQVDKIAVLETADENEEFAVLEVEDIKYEYSSNQLNEIFKIGPVSSTFSAGEITFIVGGNGSGKTTLAKILAGLYTPSEGKIYVNNVNVKNEVLSENYSIVFSDYYMFDKLYGIDHIEKNDEITEKLKLLKLEDKVVFKDGAFNASGLSTGQKKRLALMISYVEDKAICLFDEWAADQDPEFRKFFYEVLLIELRKLNKCIIVITHDDRYFHIADKVIKMESGKVVKQAQPEESLEFSLA